MREELVLPAYMIREAGNTPGSAIITKPLFSPDECVKLIREAEVEGTEPGKIGGSTGDVSNIRRSRIYWLADRPKWKWVYDRVHKNISQINRQIWNFDLRLEETIQFSRYDQYDKGHYDWHVDTLGRPQQERKISFSVQLSDPQHYDGGELTMWPDIAMSRQQGCCIVFPSYQLHRVGPVEVGTRYALVGWVLGPTFR